MAAPARCGPGPARSSVGEVVEAADRQPPPSPLTSCQPDHPRIVPPESSPMHSTARKINSQKRPDRSPAVFVLEAGERQKIASAFPPGPIRIEWVVWAGRARGRWESSTNHETWRRSSLPNSRTATGATDADEGRRDNPWSSSTRASAPRGTAPARPSACHSVSRAGGNPTFIVNVTQAAASSPPLYCRHA